MSWATLMELLGLCAACLHAAFGAYFGKGWMLAATARNFCCFVV